MTFFAHAIAGAAVHAGLGTGLRAVSSHSGISRKLWWILIISGAVFGMAPDAVDWLAWILSLADRWVIYGLMHHGWLSTVLSFVPAYWLHLAMDRIVHLYPGYNWWDQFWWIEIAHWLAGGVVIWRTYRHVAPD